MKRVIASILVGVMCVGSFAAFAETLEHKDQRVGVESYSYKTSPKFDETNANHKDERVGVENYSYLTGLKKDHSAEVKDENATHVDERTNTGNYGYLTGKANFQ